MKSDKLLTGVDDIDLVEENYLAVDGKGELVKVPSPPNLPQDELIRRGNLEIDELKNTASE